MLKTTRKGNWLEIMIPDNWEGQTLENLFRNNWQAPRKLTHLFRMEKKVFVNGKPANWTVPLHVNDRIQLHVFSEEHSSIPGYNQEIEVLYEDDHVIVLNKPPFMSTHPNDPKTDKNTLLNAILFYLQTKEEISSIHQIHRLDKDTSGAILFAKHSLAGSILDRKLENREIKRTYIAMVHGNMKKKKGTINKPIGRDRHHATRRRVSENGQAAVTHYEVLKEDKNFSYVKCWLDTGRTHQIRVHLSSEGHPLAGDILYGGKPVVKRQALHAAKLEFLHPFTEEHIICHAPFIDKPSIFKNINVFSI